MGSHSAVYFTKLVHGCEVVGMLSGAFVGVLAGGSIGPKQMEKILNKRRVHNVTVQSCLITGTAALSIPGGLVVGSWIGRAAGMCAPWVVPIGAAALAAQAVYHRCQSTPITHANDLNITDIW